MKAFKDVRPPKRSNVVVLPSRKWIFNGIILQFSAILFQGTTNSYIEAIILSLNNDIEKHPHIKCAVFSNLNNSFLAYETVIEKFMMDRYGAKIFRIKCNVAKALAFHENISISILETNATIKNGTIMFAQLPTVVSEKGLTLRKAIINCVHMLRNVDFESYKRISNWLVLQQAIGIDKIRFYDINTNKTYVNQIKSDHPTFVEFVNYQYNINDSCHWLESYGLQNCAKKYGGYFVDQLENLHERLVMNDCLYHAKYTHEWLINYDIDDFIFPRSITFDGNFSQKVLLNQHDPENCTVKNSKMPEKYSLYDFVQGLKARFGPRNAYFQFEHYLVVAKPEVFFESLENEISNSNAKYVNELTYLNYKWEKNRFDEDNYARSLFDLKNLVKCLNETFMKPHMDNMNPKWTRTLKALINTRDGLFAFC